MVKEILKGKSIFREKSSNATIFDVSVAQDLLDTLKFNSRTCVGMAANMIGVNKRIIAINDDGKFLVMLNPEITAQKDRYTTEEGCLSLESVRQATRYKSITIKYQDINFKNKTQSFSGFTAQIIQHEVDHCNGIII